jgi:uncharacterized protein
MKISGARILITGGSRGIGEALARELHRQGAHLALVARNAELLDRVASELGPHTHAVPADLSDPTQVAGLVARCEGALGGPVDVVVNNAGLDEIGMLADAEAEDVRRIHQVNLLTPIELCRQALPAMLGRNAGQIVNVSSMAGSGAFTGMTLYASTKGGLTSFTGVLNHELRKTGIDVTIVELGPIPTDMLAGIDEFEPARRSFERSAKLQLLPEVDRATVAREIAIAIAKGKHAVRLPKRAAAFPMMRAIPQRTLDLILRDLPAQEPGQKK